MHHSQVKHTIEIFEMVNDNLPPLVPKEIEEELEHSLEHLRDDYLVGINEAESMMISLGKKVWPYWKAFFEFYDMEQGRMGEKFLLGKLSPDLKKRFKEFKEHGGSYRDLRSGGAVVFFETEERQIFTEAFVDVDKYIKQHTRQSVLSLERPKYEKLILDFQVTLDDIEKRLDSLRLLAEDEEEHPELAIEIRQRVRDFEYGLCLLGPNSRHEEIINTEDYFKERREFKKHFGM